MHRLLTAFWRLPRFRRHEAAWARFVELYAPLIFHWAKTRGLSPTDAADLVQDVLAVLVETDCISEVWRLPLRVYLQTYLQSKIPSDRNNRYAQRHPLGP